MERGGYGTRGSALASRCADSDHHPARPPLALTALEPPMTAPGVISEVHTTEEAILSNGASRSGVSWGAIIGGAFAAMGITLILLALGAGFGLAMASPWSVSGASAAGFSLLTALWLIVTQWASAGAGGYIAGRLRVKWAGLHTHEVFFRDTAHGFLAWCVATIIGAAVLGSAVSALVGATTTAESNMASAAAIGQAEDAGRTGSAQIGTLADPIGYFIDLLFRTDHPETNQSGREMQAEGSRILLNGLRNGSLPATDKTYLAQLVAARSGLSQEAAQKRVDEVLEQETAWQAKSRATANAARRAGTYLAIFTGLSMLIGAFIACIAAALGGQRRDVHD